MPNNKSSAFSLQHLDNSKGFTLIELMVAISIIAILSMVGLVSYGAVQKQARDSKRIQDAKAIVTALETYKSANGDYFPTTGLSATSGSYDACLDTHDASINELVPAYLKKMPSDPQFKPPGGAEMRCYFYRKGPGAGKFTLYIRLENPKSSPQQCTTTQLYRTEVTKFNYCITEP